MLPIAAAATSKRGAEGGRRIGGRLQPAQHAAARKAFFILKEFEFDGLTGDGMLDKDHFSVVARDAVATESDISDVYYEAFFCLGGTLNALSWSRLCHCSPVQIQWSPATCDL